MSLNCLRLSSEITIEVILYKYSRQIYYASSAGLNHVATDAILAAEVENSSGSLGRGPHKNCENDLDDQTRLELE